VLEKLAASADVSARHHKYSLPDADMQDLLGDKAQTLGWMLGHCPASQTPLQRQMPCRCGFARRAADVSALNSAAKSCIRVVASKAQSMGG
jgi:hypothetical protein